MNAQEVAENIITYFATDVENGRIAEWVADQPEAEDMSPEEFEAFVSEVDGLIADASVIVVF